MNASRRDPGQRVVPSWASYRDSIGDRSGLFAALSKPWNPAKALYPGSYLDLSPRDSDPLGHLRRHRERHATSPASRSWQPTCRGAHCPERAPKWRSSTWTTQSHSRSPQRASTYSSRCTRVRSGSTAEPLSAQGLFLANASHGDASLAAHDPTLQLVAAVQQRGGKYRLDTKELDSYLIPKRPAAADPEMIRRQRRGIAYTKTAFAYIFRAAAPRMIHRA